MPPGSLPGESRGAAKPGITKTMSSEKKKTGRPLGSKNKRAVLTAEHLAKAGAVLLGNMTDGERAAMTALDVLRMAMRAALDAKMIQTAAAYAEKIAPYETPRLATTTVVSKNMDANRSDEDLRAELAEIEARNGGKAASELPN